MTPVPVILDVDTGVDDAMALLLAVGSPALDLRGVTCVAGNAGLEPVIANTLKVLDIAGARADLPVAAGATRPLVDPPHLTDPLARQGAEHIHGADGMADLGLPASKREVDARSAVTLLRDLIDGSEQKITLVSLAPMTNIAMLLRTHPAVLENVERIVVMGGAATGGNVTAVAEFNVFADPEAAAAVFSAGVPITMYGLDVFYSVRVPGEEIAALVASSDERARLAGRLLQHRAVGDSSEIGDAGAVASVIAPTGLGIQRLPVRVELTGHFTRGQTIVDRRTDGNVDEDPYRAYPAPVIDVALAVDAERYAQIFLDVVRGA
jgi:pyrimidine-specific ribonucleoside hydrolase